MSPYRRELCAQCFFYDGSRLKVKHTSESSGRILRTFCSSACHKAWKSDMDEANLEAVDVVESLREQKNARTTSKTIFDGHDTLPGAATEVEVEEAWSDADEIAKRIGKLRLQSHLEKKVSRKPLNKLIKSIPPLHPDDDDDLLTLFLHAIIHRRKDSAAFREMLKLHPTNVYFSPQTGYSSLRMHIRMFLCFIIHLPVELLPYCTPDLFVSVIFRDFGNSFGIWSEGGYMLAYGLYPSASFYNHSCEPNVVRKRNGQGMEFATLRDIEGGEELTISYLGDLSSSLSLDLRARRKKLKEGWAFDCHCQRCEREDAEEED